MKKIILFITLGTAITLAGCSSKAIGAKDAGELLVSQMVYENQAKKFDENFADGSKLNTALKGMSENVMDEFFEDIHMKDDKVGDALKKSISESLKDKVVNDTQFFALEKSTTDKDTHSIQYQIYGLNYGSVIDKCASTVVKKVVEDKELVKDLTKVDALVSKTIEAEMQNVKKVDEPVYSEIDYGVDHGKYYVKAGQQEKLRTIYYQFLTGMENEKAFQDKISSTLSKAQKEVEAKLAKEKKTENNETKQ